MLACNLQITKKKHSNPSPPITIKRNTGITYEMNNISINPQAPNSPPMNTPPNIDILRELYLSYLSNMTKQ